jgi:AcrR family transcriptional regulator
MATSDRRQREREEREARILEMSRPMLLEGGYHTLNMERIAEGLEYAKGTIYNHFRNKEEIIIALAIQTQEKRAEIFGRAAAFNGSSRERLCAAGIAAELFVRNYPEHFQVEQILRSASIWEKTSEQRRVVMRSCETRCVGIVGGIVREAVENGDLVLPVGFTPEDMVFGLWSLTYGAHTIMSSSDSLNELGIKDPPRAVNTHMQMLLDGFGWKPLSMEHDYDKVAERIYQEVFSDEVADASS